MATDALFQEIPEIKPEPLQRRGGGIYTGRFQVPYPQWLLNPDDRHATAGLSIREIVEAAESRLIWTDQLVQRGIKPGKDNEQDIEVELPLEDGYPDPALYVFNADKADAIAERLLEGDPSLKLSPLVWNLRPGRFQAAINQEVDGEPLYLYSGRIYLPDGHHRHQAVLKAFKTWNEAQNEYPSFDPERQFTVDIYFMSRRDEAEYFFQKNYLPQLVERSKSFDLTEQDSLAVLAKRLIDEAPSLQRNVNRVTDRLVSSNPQLVTLSTLREMVKLAVGTDDLTEDEIEAKAALLATFWQALAGVRDELNPKDVAERRELRNNSMVGQAVSMFGYGELMKRYLAEAEAGDPEAVADRWRTELLPKLAATETYTHGDWSGDLFDRKNPLWRERGVIQLTKSGGETISNTRQTREQMGQVLVERLGL